MTVSELLQQAYSRLGYSDTPQPAVTQQLLDFMGETHRDLLRMPGMEGLRDASLTVTTTADQEYIALPDGIARIKSIRDTTDNVVLDSIDLRTLRRINADGTTGDPWAFAIDGRRAMQLELASPPDGVYTVSTAAGDTNQALTLKGLSGDGVPVTVTSSMNGTTAVTVSGTWYSIEEAYLSYPCTGDVTVSTDTGGLTPVNVKIPIGQTSIRHLWIRLCLVPSSAITYTIDYTRRIDDFGKVLTQEPLIPEDFHYLLLVGMRAKMYERREKTREVRLAQAELRDGIRDLMYWVHTSGVQDSGLNVPPRSQLGPWYPAGS